LAAKKKKRGKAWGKNLRSGEERSREEEKKSRTELYGRGCVLLSNLLPSNTVVLGRFEMFVVES